MRKILFEAFLMAKFKKLNLYQVLMLQPFSQTQACPNDVLCIHAGAG